MCKPVTEVITIHLASNTANVETTLREVVADISQYEGYKRARWGRRINTPDIVDFLIGTYL